MRIWNAEHILLYPFTAYGLRYTYEDLKPQSVRKNWG